MRKYAMGFVVLAAGMYPLKAATTSVLPARAGTFGGTWAGNAPWGGVSLPAAEEPVRPDLADGIFKKARAGRLVETSA